MIHSLCTNVMKNSNRILNAKGKPQDRFRSEVFTVEERQTFEFERKETDDPLQRHTSSLSNNLRVNIWVSLVMPCEH